MAAWKCPRHECEQDNWCDQCLREWNERRSANEMTREERLSEFDSWGTILTIPFSKLHQRFEELLGRPIWSHEFAHMARLREELTGEKPIATLNEILDLIPEEKRIIVWKGA